MATNDHNGTHPDIPDKNWTNRFPEQHPLHDLYERRIRNNQDLIILIDDWHSRRGTGKSVASLQLAEAMDQNGGITFDNVTLEPERLRNAYGELPTQSALVFDEGELGASNREAMTNTNKALREIMSIGRVEEKYVIINTPDKEFIDKDIQKLADVWMTMLTKGVALIHYLKENPYAKGDQTLTETNGLIQFRDIQRDTRLRDVYNRATRQKKKHIDGGDTGERYIEQSEHEEKLQKAREEARKEARNELLRDVYEHPEHQASTAVSQRSLAESVGLSQPQVGRIINGR